MINPENSYWRGALLGRTIEKAATNTSTPKSYVHSAYTEWGGVKVNKMKDLTGKFEVRRFTVPDGSSNVYGYIHNLEKNNNILYDVMTESKTKPVQRKFLTGFKGKVEQLAHKIGNNKAGCERPLLRNIEALALKILRKGK